MTRTSPQTDLDAPANPRTYTAREIAEQLLITLRMMRHAKTWELGPGNDRYTDVEHVYGLALYSGCRLSGDRTDDIVIATVEHDMTITEAITLLCRPRPAAPAAPISYALRFSGRGDQAGLAIIRELPAGTDRVAANKALAQLRIERIGTDAHVAYLAGDRWLTALPTRLNLEPLLPDEDMVGELQRQGWVLKDADTAAEARGETISPHYDGAKNRRVLLAAGEIYQIEHGKKVPIR